MKTNGNLVLTTSREEVLEVISPSGEVTVIRSIRRGGRIRHVISAPMTVNIRRRRLAKAKAGAA